MAVETVSSYFRLTVTSSLTAFGSEKRFQSSVTIGELKVRRLYTGITCAVDNNQNNMLYVSYCMTFVRL